MASDDKTNNWRAWDQPSLLSIQVFMWAFKEFNKKNAWEKWSKEEKDLIKQHFDIKIKGFPSFLDKRTPAKGYHGLFVAVVRARETAWILKEKNINININEFIDYTNCWKKNEYENM